MNNWRLDQLWQFLAGIEWAMAMLWLGVTALTVALAILMYTRWGQYKPLRKCMAMSLLVHLLLAGYATTIEMVGPIRRPTEEIMLISLGDGPELDAPPGGDGPEQSDTGQPWAVFPSPAVGQLAAAETAASSAEEQEESPTEQQHEPSKTSESLAELASSPMAEETAVVQADGYPADNAAALLEQIVPLPEKAEAGSSQVTYASSVSTRSTVTVERVEVPDAYRLRVAPNRENLLQSRGGTSATEAAVKAALRWLADNQSADGRWDPRLHGAGQESQVLNRHRQNAGSRADTAMTGLALLSFLGSGHTHLEGPYQDDIRRGLEFLIRNQAADGNLGGHAASFELMYCHAMAACALSEALGMTGDQRLREPVRRAVDYTVAAQDANGGGWRYRPGEPGDTSQLGWQLMALRSAELAGIPVPNETRARAIRFLRSVSSGSYGGLASYRPQERHTRPMTAEALFCWQLLGLSREHPACNEAGEYLMGELPDQGTYNLYYWYYATLSMYNLQGDYWQRWNVSLRDALLKRQIKDGPLAGSWDVSDLWGGHGGRVYTTALATLILEVYYRFLPLYAGVGGEIAGN